MNAPAIAPLESRRFGVSIMRVTCATADDVRHAVAAARRLDARLLIARCDHSSLAAVHELERQGATLMETLLYFSRNLARDLPPVDPGVSVRPVASSADAQSVSAIAAEAFRGYVGHFHADPRLDRAQCDAAYVEWSERCCASRDFADVVLLAAAPAPAGYCALLRDSDRQFDIRLLAVAPAFQRRGIAQALLASAMHWARAQQADTLTISTQLANFASQKACVRAGFEPCRSYYTFHRWSDDA